MDPTASQLALRALPAVDRILAWAELDDLPRAVRLDAIRAELDAVRAAILDGTRTEPPAREVLIAAIRERAERATRPALRRVINATGVLLHTNLGRAPLVEAALDAAGRAAGSCNIEYDLDAGCRGERGQRVLERLCELSGAEAALVVNNCAAAVLLAISALGCNGEVVVSRGELVEIGGSYRVPDVIVQGGARLREVGTTNRTRASDYAGAIGPDTRILLKTHASNFAIVGFTESVSLEALAGLAVEARRTHEAAIHVVEDLGSASFLPLLDAPHPADSLRAGADVVCFSGDKLLGGPQAGIVLGCTEAVAAMRRHPLYRALRPGKLTLAALDATLQLHARGEAAVASGALPLHHAAAVDLEALTRRATALVEGLRETTGLHLELVDTLATVGGGSLPGQTLPSRGLALWVEGLDAEALAARLRGLDTPVIGRVRQRRVIVDLRTVPAALDAVLARCLRQVVDRQKG